MRISEPFCKPLSLPDTAPALVAEHRSLRNALGFCLIRENLEWHSGLCFPKNHQKPIGSSTTFGSYFMLGFNMVLTVLWCLNMVLT